MDGFNFNELCRMVGKDSFYVRNLQRALDLHIPSDGETYSECYALFMEKIIALRAFCVPVDDIRELLDAERKILRLLHVDTLTDSPTWYLDGCRDPGEDGEAEDRLLLTGYALGFPSDARTIQHTLDFGKRNPELFKSAEMGEDVRRVLEKYRTLLEGVREKVERERPVLENALHWARRFLRR